MKDEFSMDAERQPQPATANLLPESNHDQYFERMTSIAARALNLPISVIFLDNLGQPEVMGACGCKRVQSGCPIAWGDVLLPDAPMR
ncbi:hypothetical protein [Paraburkholderia xenovorans]|uniref:hypothetical protein n=1 Tax=Paraburkholderia xenovorans TaxID=36873 RepID=UPI0038BBAFD3